MALQRKNGAAGRRARGGRPPPRTVRRSRGYGRPPTAGALESTPAAGHPLGDTPTRANTRRPPESLAPDEPSNTSFPGPGEACRTFSVVSEARESSGDADLLLSADGQSPSPHSWATTHPASWLGVRSVDPHRRPRTPPPLDGRGSRRSASGCGGRRSTLGHGVVSDAHRASHDPSGSTR